MPLGDVQRLRAFALVLDLGSISAAASVLGYTQSAVSQQLAALEREMGTPLVDRSQRPLRATAAGALLQPHVERVLAAVGGAEAAADELRSGSPRLRLAAFPSALSSFVPAAVRDMRRAHPDLVVRVLQLETREAVERLRGGDADLAVIHHMPGLAVPDTTGLERRRLLIDHLHVVVPDGHRLARRGAVSIADLETEPLILPRRDTPAGRFRSIVEHLCAQAGFAPRIAYELDDLPAAQAFVAAGIAVVPMHGLVLATLPLGVAALPLAERPASRTVEALAPVGASSTVVTDLVDRLARAADAYRVSPPAEAPAGSRPRSSRSRQRGRAS
jgi:DNA-binding transcriptional LysR family regulator